MANPINTTIDNGSPFYANPTFDQASLYFAGADTFAEGTILARRHTAADSYAGTITGTGTRVATLSAPDGKLKVGAYTLLAVSLTTGVGRWQLTDPDGQVAQFTTLAAGDNLYFDSLGVFVDIADTGTNYVTNDSVAFTVVAASGYRLFAVGGANGSGIPSAILAHSLTKAGSGALPASVLVAGQVNKSRLVIDADGNSNNLSADHIAALRSVGILVLVVQDLATLDNA